MSAVVLVAHGSGEVDERVLVGREQRGRDLLRLGPAPYLTDDEIDRGARAVIDELR